MGEGHVRLADAFSSLHAYFAEGEALVFCPQLGVLGRTADVFPPVGIKGSLEGDAIELPVTEEDRVSPLRTIWWTRSSNYTWASSGKWPSFPSTTIRATGRARFL